MGVRVASFNLLHGLSPADGRVEPERLRAAVRELDADVLCLQEVDRDQPRSGGLDLTAICAEAGAAPWSRFEPALGGLPGAWAADTGPQAADDAVTGPQFGVALISRFPVVSWHVRRLAAPRLPMPMPGLVPVERRGRVRLAPPQLIRDEPRVLLAAVLATPGGPLAVGCAHLTFVQGPNIRQLRTAVDLLRPLPGPRLLLGDLNMAGRLPALVSRWQPLVAGRTFPCWRPRLQIDHVLADRPLPVRAAQVLRLPVSDHCAVVADLDY